MIKPLRNFVAIKADPDMAKSELLLFIKPVKSNLGTVVGVGPGIYDKHNVLIETGLSVGDRILFDIAQAELHIIDGEELYFTVSSTIVGKLDKEEVDKQ